MQEVAYNLKAKPYQVETSVSICQNFGCTVIAKFSLQLANACMYNKHQNESEILQVGIGYVPCHENINECILLSENLQPDTYAEA